MKKYDYINNYIYSNKNSLKWQFVLILKVFN